MEGMEVGIEVGMGVKVGGQAAAVRLLWPD